MVNIPSMEVANHLGTLAQLIGTDIFQNAVHHYLLYPNKLIYYALIYCWFEIFDPLNMIDAIEIKLQRRRRRRTAGSSKCYC